MRPPVLVVVRAAARCVLLDKQIRMEIAWVTAFQAAFAIRILTLIVLLA